MIYLYFYQFVTLVIHIDAPRQRGAYILSSKPNNSWEGKQEQGIMQVCPIIIIHALNPKEAAGEDWP